MHISIIAKLFALHISTDRKLCPYSVLIGPEFCHVRLEVRPSEQLTSANIHTHTNTALQHVFRCSILSSPHVFLLCPIPRGKILKTDATCTNTVAKGHTRHLDNAFIISAEDRLYKARKLNKSREVSTTMKFKGAGETVANPSTVGIFLN